MSGVTIRTVDGRSLERRIPVARGGAGRPWKDHELAEKFLSLATPVLGELRALELRQFVLALEERGDLAGLYHLIGAFQEP
jgi:hypothetical protein